MNRQQLFEWDKLALELRKERKYKLSIRPEISDNKIIFPAHHISEHDNTLLRYAMNPLYNGFAIVWPEGGLFVDPGIDFGYRRVKSGYPISRCDVLYISHQHIDHCGGAPELLEWLLRAGKHIDICMTPETAAEWNIPAYYLGNNPERAHHELHRLDKEKIIWCRWCTLQTIPHFHGISCYGFSTVVDDKKITYISDTGYATLIKDDEGEKIPGEDDIVWKPHIVTKYESLRTALRGSHVAIVNMDTFTYRKGVSKTHSSAWDIIDMVKDNEINNLIIAHIMPNVHYTSKWIEELRVFIEQETGVKTWIPGESGLEFAL